MSGTRGNDRLHMLGRWRELELDQVQTELARSRSVVQREQNAVQDLETQLTRSQEEARRLTASTQHLSVDVLRMYGGYRTLQQRTLEEQKTALRKAEDAAESVRSELAERFKDLSVVEKLRMRRHAEAAVQSARAAQNDLDEQALLAQCRDRIGQD